ncbi:MAG: tetratricopeptide repeat protein [Fidelibacterota bacterium]
MRLFRLNLVFLWVILSGCAYFNTFYNAKTYYSEATRQMEEDLNKDGKISRATYSTFENASLKAQKVIERFPDSDYVDDAMYIAGVSNFHLQKYTIARTMFSRLTIEFPSSPYYAESHLWIARCYYELGEKDIAFRMLEEFIADSKNKVFFGEAMSLAGYLALEEGEDEKAFEYFNQAVDMSHDIQSKSNLLFELSQIYIDRSMLEKALSVLQEIEEISIDPLMLTRVQLQYAKIYRIREMYEESEDLIKEMLANEENQPVFPDLELELAQVYTQQNKMDQAIQRYKTVTENYPNTPQAAKASYNLGEIYLHGLNDYESARNAFIAVRQHDRNCLEATLAQSKINEIGQFVSLNNEIQNLEEEYPALMNPEVEKDTSLTDKVINDFVKNKFRQAEFLAFNFQSPDSALGIYQSLTTRFKDNPFIPQILNTWSYLLKETGDTLRAEMLKNRLIREYPYSPFSLQYLGREHPDSLKQEKNQSLIFHIEETYFNQAREQEGMKAFKALLDTASLDSVSRAQVMYRLGLEYDQTFSDLDSAMFYYQLVKNRFASTKYADAAEKRMNELNRIIEKLMEASADDTLETPVVDSTQGLEMMMDEMARDSLQRKEAHESMQE